MKVLLDKIYDTQVDLEDALLLECSLDEAKETADGRKLIRYLKKRRRIVLRALRMLERV
jgi:hypothetical protein